MTTRISNSRYLTVLDGLPLDNIGWTVRAKSERDYATQIVDTSRFVSLGFTKEKNVEGGGRITLDADTPFLTAALPVSENAKVLNQEALWQFVEDGIVRFEMLHEDTEEDVIPEGGGPRQTTLTGRGTGMVLEWAKVLPAGMPNPKSMTRTTTDMHPLEVWTRLFLEAQTNGYLTFVTLLFTPTTDSAGNPWGQAQSVTVNAGEDLLSLLKRWCDANDYVWRMLPGFRLQVLPTLGRRLEKTVVFTQYRGQEKQSRTVTRREIASDVYVSSGDKGVAVAFDAASRIKWKKRMAWVTAGDAADATGRSQVANSTLSLVKDQKVSRTVKVPPYGTGRRIFVDYDVSDWVQIEVPDDDTESGARRVLAATIDVDSNGKVDLELTTQSRFESRAEKVKRLLDALGASTAPSGTGASVIPTSTAILSSKVSDLSDVDLTGITVGDTLRWNGTKWVDVTPNLDWLADVDTVTTAPADKQALVYDAPSGLWKPGSVAAGGGGTTSSVATASFRKNTVESSGPVPTTPAVVPGPMSLSGIVGGRTVIISAVVAHDGHANRYSIWVDGAQILPNESGMTSTDVGQYLWTVAGLAVPLGSGTHTIEVRWSAQGSTSAVSFKERSLTVSGDSTITNRVYGSPFDVPPADSGFNDEFDGGAAAAFWTNTPTAPAGWDAATKKGAVLLTASGSAATIVGKMRSAPTSYPWTAVTKVQTSSGRANYHRAGGLYLLPSGATAASPGVYVGATFESTLKAQRIRYASQSAFGDNTGVELSLGLISAPVYFRIDATSATAISCYVSMDGFVWVPIQTGYTVPFSIAQVGIACSEEGGGGVTAAFEFFRIGTAALPALYGVS